MTSQYVPDQQDPEQLLTTALRANSIDILHYLQRRVGADDAPDLMGETFLIAWRRVQDLPSDVVEARMWLFGVARGALQNHARTERRRLALADKLRQHMHLAGGVPAADDGQEVRDAINRLPPDLAEAVQLVHWDGFSLAEAAQIAGVGAPAMRARYSRARKRLQRILAPAPEGSQQPSR